LDEVDIRLGERDESPRSVDELRELYSRARQMRREAADWIGVTRHFEVLDIFGATPATDIAYRWLWNDLKRISWTRNLFR
jgi:hypothetical protein